MISMVHSAGHSDSRVIAANLRRLMARDGLTYDDIVHASGLDERTVRGIVQGKNKPHARTLHKLATGLGVSTDELFRSIGQSPERRFDRATNSLVESVAAAHCEVFDRWTNSDFDELYSRFGTGGQLTEAGVLAAAQTMNAKRQLLRQISVILESNEAELLAEFVELLHRRVTNVPRTSVHCKTD